MEFTPLERDILHWMASRASQAGDQTLADQFKSAVAISREFTGCGSFTKMSISAADAPRVNYRVAPVDPHIESPEIQDGAGVVLFFEDGLASLLEIYTFTSPLPTEVRQWKLS